MPNPVQTFAFPEVEPQFFTNLSLREYKRPGPGKPLATTLKTYIRLPIPSNLQDVYGIDVSSPSFATFNAIAAAGQAIFNTDSATLIASGKSKVENIVNWAASGSFRKNGLNVATEIAALSPGNSDLSRFAQSTAGVVRNPHITSIFDGVKLKAHEFTWRLAPRSLQEAQKMNQMVNYIKQYMHPAIIQGSAGFALDYPYIATVEFANLPKEITPYVNDSFITGLTINNSAGGMAFFKDGQPITTDISIHFQEINIRTREDFGGPGSNKQLEVSQVINGGIAQNNRDRQN